MPPEDIQDPQGDSKYNPATVEDAMRIITALEKRLGERDATIEQQKANINTLGERITAIEAASRKKLEEQGNFSELKTQLQAEIEALKPTAERAAALEKILRESNEARIKNVPEQIRSMIPMDYPPERLQKWLADNEALLSKPPAPNFDAGAGAGAGQGIVTPKLTDEQKQLAKKVGMTDEQYAAAMHKAQGET